MTILDRFSRRHGLEPAEVPITVRQDAPPKLRAAVAQIARDAGLQLSSVRKIVCRVLHETEDPNNWSSPNILQEVRELLDSCDWFLVYDVIEEIYRHLARSATELDKAELFAEEINRFFRANGIGWQLVEGKVEARGSDLFEEATGAANHLLTAAGQPTAAAEMAKARQDLSRRPKPDLTGALHHALAAMEVLARSVTGEEKFTLGKLLKKSEDLLPPPLDKAAEALWGYASERGRHLREGEEPDYIDVEFIVTTVAALITYLARRHRLPDDDPASM